MLMITLMMLYVHVIIFYVESNDDELDVMGLHYFIMFHGHWPNDVDDYSLSEHHVSNGTYGAHGMNGLLFMLLLIKGWLNMSLKENIDSWWL